MTNINKMNLTSLFRIMMLLLLCFVMTATLQSWVGDHTIYGKKLRDQRIILHERIFENALPEGKSWKDYGATGTNVRVFVVYLVEYVHKLSGASICQLYRTVDSISLFLCFVGLFFYLRHWFDDHYCLIGLCYTAIVFVMTYYFHYFHPWDRISLLSWLLLIYLLREKRNILFAILLAVSVTIK